MPRSSGADEWKHEESKQMQTNLAHLHGQFHTPPGLRRHSNTLQMTCHLPRASRAERWASEVAATAKAAKNKEDTQRQERTQGKLEGGH